jgi:cell division protein FtsB
LTLRPWRLLLLTAPILVALIGWGWWSGLEATRRARRELDALEARRAELERTNRQLARELQALSREREARARAARETLDAVAPGETVVILPPTPTPTVTPTPTGKPRS